MDNGRPMNRLCGAKTRSGTPCKRAAGHGTSHIGVGRCNLHGGSTPRAEMAGVVELARRESVTMGRPLDVQPHEALLECIRIAAGEVQYASDRIAELEAGEAVGHRVTTTQRPLKLEKGAEDPQQGVEEVTYAPAAVHVWIAVRHAAMDRLTNYCRIALAAGIAERQVRIAEGQAQQLAEAMRRMAVALGYDPADPKVREAMRGSLTLIRGGLAA